MLTYLGLVLSVDVEKLWHILCLSLLQKHLLLLRGRLVLHEQFISYCTARGIKSTFGAIIDNNFLFTKPFCEPKSVGSKLGGNFRAHFDAVPVDVLF